MHHSQDNKEERIIYPPQSGGRDEFGGGTKTKNARGKNSHFKFKVAAHTPHEGAIRNEEPNFLLSLDPIPCDG